MPLINKKNPASNYEYYGFFQKKEEKHFPLQPDFLYHFRKAGIRLRLESYMSWDINSHIIFHCLK